MVMYSTAQCGEWNAILEESFQHDFYHLAEYHRLAEDRGEGVARFFVYQEGVHFVGLPLLLRPVKAVPGLEAVGANLYDATSVYGYAGPVASHAEMPASVLRVFRESMKQTLLDAGVVALFSRLHPLIDQVPWLSGLGECPSAGVTISINLELPVEVQRARYRKDHKWGVNKLRRSGIECIHDKDRLFLDEFVSLYRETMERVGAQQSYFFDRLYFQQLLSDLNPDAHLFVCLYEKSVVCGGVFIECDGIVQYHLSGTVNDFLKQAPMKLLLDEVRLWATQRGATVFHLGGGVGAQEDSLFQFKAGFSDRRHDFKMWRWVVDPDAYKSLCEAKTRWNKDHGVRVASTGYFPEYRAPVVTASEPD